MNILQAHTRALTDLLDADNTAPALVVLDGVVPHGQTPPYVLVYFRLRTPSGIEVPEAVALERTSDVLDTWAYCHNVAGSPMGALAVAGRSRAVLLGVTPVVAGRLCYPIIHDDSQPTVRDESALTPVFDQVDVYSFRSIPA